MAGVKLRGVHKRFGKVHAVRGVDIEIPTARLPCWWGRPAAARARCSA